MYINVEIVELYILCCVAALDEGGVPLQPPVPHAAAAGRQLAGAAGGAGGHAGDLLQAGHTQPAQHTARPAAAGGQ